MKFAFETKGMFIAADEQRVKIHAEAGDTKIYGDATWDELSKALERTRSVVPKKARRPEAVRGEVV